MFFDLEMNDREKAVSDYKSHFHRELIRSVTEQLKQLNLTQSDVAEKLECDKSFVSKILSGQGNLTLKTVGEICWAVELIPPAKFEKKSPTQVNPNRSNTAAKQSDVVLNIDFDRSKTRLETSTSFENQSKVEYNVG